MQYIEKDFELEIIEEEKGNLLGKLPSYFMKLWLKKNVDKIREMMGGDSVDITDGTLLVEDKYIKAYRNDIRIRIYKANENKKRALMMFYHGGGWLGGSLEAVDDYCRAVADFSDCVVISVDYHLAPERPFPEGLEDSYKAILWAVENAETLNIDIEKIIVSGDSAGGNIAAALTIMAQKRQEFTIDRQILLYPVTNLSNPVQSKNKSVKAFNEVMIEMYVADKKDRTNSLVSPIFYKDLSSLPKALIAVGELDSLKDSVLVYAKALDEAEKEVQFLLYKNTKHAFIDDTGKSPQALDLIHEVSKFINE